MNKQQKRKILSYTYDETVDSVSENQITIYSLYENSIIRQAASIYQIKNPNVKINYIVATNKENGNESDFIRALNTELLTGNGADILVLDGLPVDSYIEKGVLADISNIIKPLVESNNLLGNIAKAYEINNKIYQMPTNFFTSTVIGEKEVIEKAGTLEGIVSYIQENPNLPFFCFRKGFTDEELIKNIFTLIYNDLFEESGKLNEEKFSSFLRNIKILSENGKKDTKKVDHKLGADLKSNRQESLFGTDIDPLMEKKCVCTYYAIRNEKDFFIPSAIEEQSSYSYKILNNTFIPICSVGLNSSSKEQKAASDFIDFLFSRDIQDSDRYKGFPVNESSLTEWMKKPNEDWKLAFGNSGTLKAKSPSEEKRMAFLDKLKNLEQPIEIYLAE